MRATKRARLRQAPLRRMAAAVEQQRRAGEPLAMVGILKPSLHFYTDQVVIYEGVQPNGPLNLNDRLLREQRRQQRPTPPTADASVLVVIDQRTAQLPHWQGLPHQHLRLLAYLPFLVLPYFASFALLIPWLVTLSVSRASSLAGKPLATP